MCVWGTVSRTFISVKPVAFAPKSPHSIVVIYRQQSREDVAFSGPERVQQIR